MIDKISLISIQIHSKFTLAFGGIVIVVGSVMCSLGALAYARLVTTMLTIEVIPFLVLAIGVDNLFILVHAYQRLDLSKYIKPSDAVSDALAEVGPSILLTAITQISCFAIGTWMFKLLLYTNSPIGMPIHVLKHFWFYYFATNTSTGTWTDMPAVHTFALYATAAIIFNFLLQITAFIAFMTIDLTRQEVSKAKDWSLGLNLLTSNFLSFTLVERTLWYFMLY